MSIIPFSHPYVPTLSLNYIKGALESSTQQGNGQLSKLVEGTIQKLYPEYQAFLVPSCTAALELSLMLLDIVTGDEVIISSYNFPSAATAVTKLGGTPVFCEIDSLTGCIDCDDVEMKVTSRTKAIIWVNYAGLSPNIIKLSEIAKEYNIALIEDAAHHFGSRPIQNQIRFSDFVTFSFHATKNIQCGEGGALLVKELKYVERAFVMREKGTNRRDQMLGKVLKYRWVDKGSSYLLPEICSALLCSQLDELEVILTKRRSLVELYQEELKDATDFGWDILQGTEHAGHLFALIAPNENSRDSLITQLKLKGITALSHYEDLSSSPAGLIYGSKGAICHRSVAFSQKIVRFPLFFTLSESDVERICLSIYSILGKTVRI